MECFAIVNSIIAEVDSTLSVDAAIFEPKGNSESEPVEHPSEAVSNL